jgi:hypothetical protein
MGEEMSVTVASYGGGTNSTAYLIGMYERGERPDLVLFSDTGAERPDTYTFIDIFNKWLIDHDMPEITFVKDPRWTILENCEQRKILPSLAYGYKSCSDHFKIRPQNRYVKKWQPAVDAWAKGEKVTRLIGYDAGEWYRMKTSHDDKRYVYRHPLVEWEWFRKDCEEAIHRVGLPQPRKSSCYICPAMKPEEIVALDKHFPELAERALRIEAAADLQTVKGLGRSFSWKSVLEFHKSQGSLFEVEEIPTICDCYDG